MKLVLHSGAEAPCVFARQELANYAMRIFTDVDAAVHGYALYVGLPREEDLAQLRPGAQDAVYIRVTAGAGKILGSNPGAVVIAVYRFLRACGCRFLRPGRDGEYLPACRLADVDVFVQEQASYDVRAMAIEGACSYENVLDMIDFCPKIGLNAYEFQFKEAFVFFERWYDHLQNPHARPLGITPEQTAAIMAQLKPEVKRRGLQLYTMGHGWTAEPLGLPGIGWQDLQLEVPAETKALLAQVDGKRELIMGSPLRTHLCYSNDTARKKMVDYFVEYARTHPEDDYILFTLADNKNTCCECEGCAPHRISDFTVRILNEIDARMTAEGLEQKIMLSAYYDTLWCPVEETLRNPGRFVLEFAPITRPYFESYPTEGVADTEPAPYVLNRLQIPMTMKDNMAYLNTWKKAFPGKMIATEYHFMWAHYADIGYHKISQVLHEDIQKLKAQGQVGMKTYMPQRCAVPTGLGLYTYGQTLWDASLSFGAICEDYYSHAFGEGWQAVMAHMQRLSDTFDMCIRKDGRAYTLAHCAEKLEACLAMAEGFRADGSPENCPVQTLSWAYLDIYHEYLKRLLALLLRAADDARTGREQLRQLMAWLFAMEDSVQPGWDIRELDERLGVYYQELTEV